MDRTENYQLPKWEKTDRVMMEDFNDMTGKIDKALGDHGAALVKCGNCRIVTGTYTGKSTMSSVTPCRLSFDHKPLLVVVQPGDERNSAYLLRLIMIQGSRRAYSSAADPNSTVTVTWSGNSVSWSNSDRIKQCDDFGAEYRYIALMAMDQ